MRSRAISTRILALSLILLGLSLPGWAAAQDISPANSSAAWQGLTADDMARVCPAGDGGSSILVSIKNDSGSAIEGAHVVVEFSSACGMTSWDPHEGYTDASGTIVFHPRVGLDAWTSVCCVVTSTVTASYTGPSYQIPWGGNPTDNRSWRSFDLNGDGLANGGGPDGTGAYWGDYEIFSIDYMSGTWPCRSDYTGDGLVNLADLALVNLHVPHPALKVIPADGVLEFGALDEGDTETLLLRLQNWGGGDEEVPGVTWQLIEDQSWLSLDVVSGTIPPRGPIPPPPYPTQLVYVTVNTTGLAAGPYTYDMTLNSNSAYEYLAPDVITVTMTVLPPPPDVSSAPALLELRPTQGGSDSDTLVISNLGGSDLVWSIDDTCSWTSPVPAGGTTAAGGSTLVVFDTEDLTGYEAGVEYTAAFYLNSNDPDEPSVLIGASLIISQTTGVGDRVAGLNPQNHPNPFGAQTAISYTVPEAGAPVRITIHDLQGRVVRTLVAAEQYGGEQSVVWDGRDDRGNRLGSGVFFYRIRVEDAQVTRKMILLR